MSSFWWNFHHWLHWKLSKWQLPVQPVIKISSKWRHFRFSDCTVLRQNIGVFALKTHPITRPRGRAMGCVLWDSGENWPRYNGTALYKENRPETNNKTQHSVNRSFCPSIRPSYLRMVISMLKIRRPLGRLIFNMGIAIPGKTVFLIETAPSFLELHSIIKKMLI